MAETEPLRRNWQDQRGGRIDHLITREGPMNDDDRVDEAIADSFPASDPPSWNSGRDKQTPPKSR